MLNIHKELNTENIKVQSNDHQHVYFVELQKTLSPSESLNKINY